MLLRWVYVIRVTVAAGILVGALLVWGSARPEQTFLATVAFLAALALSAVSYRFTHVNLRDASQGFLYAQSLFDAALATVVIHSTGGSESALTSLYILVISVAALLLPMPGVFVIAGSAIAMLLGDTLLLQGGPVVTGTLVLPVLFGLVAVVTGFLGARLRQAGTAIGEARSELQKLRVDTGDILANLSTGLLTVDQEGRLAYMNLAAESLLGLGAADLAQTPILTRIGDVSPGLSRVLRHSMDSGRPVLRSKVPARRNGEDKVFGLSTAVLQRTEGHGPTVTVVFQDITDAARIEALNRRNERLEAIAELSASLAHEIKNPLASIRSSVEQLGNPTLEKADQELLRALVLSESDRLSRLLSDFIEFARIRSGRVEAVQLSEVVDTAVALTREHPDVGDSVRIDVEGTDRPVWVNGDADLLHRAVFNLALNAGQFAGSGGRVRVRLESGSPAVSGSGGPLDGSVRLSVDDTGPGVSDEESDRIFDPFVTGRPGGSGLGLSMVHRAVEAHHGAVIVERSDLGGARFTIYLPDEPEPAPVQPEAPVGALAGAPVGARVGVQARTPAREPASKETHA